MSKEYIAKKLKEYREKSDITVSDVANRFGKSIKTIYSWESGQGQPDADTLIELCLLYGIDDFSVLNESLVNEQKEMHPSVDDECMLNMLENEPKVREFFEFVLSLPEEKKDKFLSSVMNLILFDSEE